ncbi:uncharacterized protein N7473_000005 [Penicillium subrubescens]|uniref:uncharacterized protein n=1 Tax=Penicillium subrubescens TaxID=1316194 RepID=UPI0025451233|nr:uncharacterized protein N7473_000005 [Penicillium subrubescens]KAJ5910702.1 hypothetical protein N7473_000005 [Penicillium subrubescens]
MLGDAELGTLAAGITSLSAESTHYNDQLQDLLERFRNVLRDYSAIRDKFEEAKKTRQLEKQVDRNSFVEGGIDAAHELRDRIRDLMLSTKQTQLQECQIMVRAYANVLGLSSTLARAGIVHDEAQALQEFTTAFTRGQGLFDFADAGTKKESSDFKKGGRNDLISLLKAGSFHRDFETLDLSIEELPSVFTSTPLDAKDNKMRLEKGNPFRLPAISPQPLAEESQKRLDGLWENRFHNQLARGSSSFDMQDACKIYIPNSVATSHLDNLFSVNLLGELRQQKILYH